MVSMKWQIANDDLNKMPKATTIEHESFDKFRVQTFSSNFIEDEQRFKEF